MKAILLAAAITLGAAGAAVAQDSSTTPAMNQPSNGQTPSDTAGASTPDTAGTSTTMPADSSAPAPAASDSSAMPAPAAAASSDYPPCSRTVTDKCVEGGARKMMHKRR